MLNNSMTYEHLQILSRRFFLWFWPCLCVSALQLAMRGPPGPMGLTGRSGPVVSLWLLVENVLTHACPQLTYNNQSCCTQNPFGCVSWVAYIIHLCTSPYCLHLLFQNVLEETKTRFKILLPQHLVAQQSHCLPVRCNQLPDFLHVALPPPLSWACWYMIHCLSAGKDPTKDKEIYPLWNVLLTGWRPSVI